MKRTKYVTGILAAASMALTCASSYGYVGPTNFFAYNFDSSSQAATFGNWFGGDYITNAWDNSADSSNNANSGSLELQVHYAGSQYVLWDGHAPAAYSGLLPLAGTVRFTNIQYDVKYGTAVYPEIRTNVSPWDFGDARYGMNESSYAQDWIYYYQIPATNSLGQPNTGWTHMNIDLSQVPVNFPALATSGIMNTMFAQDDGAYGNNVLGGTQLIWFDNIFFTGWVAPVPPPTLSMETTRPGLDLFPGVGIYGRSQLQINTNYLNEGWIGAGTTYPVKYSFTLAGNATTPGALDTHLTFLPSPPDTPEGNSGADYQQPNCLWLQMVSGTGTNTSVVCNFSWKTNDGGTNPNLVHTNSLGIRSGGGVAVYFTNAVRAGTWTVEFDSPTTGSITCPGGNVNSMGVNPIPFNLASPSVTSNMFGTNYTTWAAGNDIAPPMTIDIATNNFANPMYVRFGNMNLGNGSRTQPDVWDGISVSGTAGTNFTVNFTQQGYNMASAPSGLDTALWDLTSSDGGAAVTILVPTNAPYWVKWTTPDTGWNDLVTATNITGPWNPNEHYNGSNTNGINGGSGYADGTNNLYVVPTQMLNAGTKWNLMLPQYLPTVNGAPGGQLSPTAFFRLTTDTNRAGL